jgi:hypothetical protein
MVPRAGQAGEGSCGALPTTDISCGTWNAPKPEAVTTTPCHVMTPWMTAGGRPMTDLGGELDDPLHAAHLRLRVPDVHLGNGHASSSASSPAMIAL